MSAEKRRRSANFNDDEKMRFLRILQKKGKVILTKSTSHDMQTNRLKDVAWEQITSDLNACGNVLRTCVNLKKLWQKLKTEAKTFKAIAYNQTIGTGGGPSKKTDDPVLELVADITGRATTGIETVDDCDSGMSYTNTELDSKKKVISIRKSTPSPFDPQQDVSPKRVSEDTKNHLSPHDPSTSTPIVVQRSDGSQSVADEDVSYFEVHMEEVENVTPTDIHVVTPKNLEKGKENLKRRRPLIDNSNERSDIKAARVRLHNTFASERPRCEKEKCALIALQKEHMLQLHALKIENIKKQAELKTSIMEAILKKIQDEKPVDPELIKFALCNNE